MKSPPANTAGHSVLSAGSRADVPQPPATARAAPGRPATSGGPSTRAARTAGGDAAEPGAAGLGDQGVADRLGAVGPPHQQTGRQQDLGEPDDRSTPHPKRPDPLIVRRPRPDPAPPGHPRGRSGRSR